MSTQTMKQKYIPLGGKCSCIVRFCQLEERLAHETTTGVEDSGSYLLGWILLCNLVEGSIHTLGVRDICADANGLSPA